MLDLYLKLGTIVNTREGNRATQLILEITMNIEINKKLINVTVTVDNIIDYNAENGFAPDDICTNNWFGINAIVDLSYQDHQTDDYIQVQYDNQNQCWSLDCDGNASADSVKKSLLSLFSKEELYTTDTSEEIEYTYESDLYCDLMNNYLPQIAQYICKVAEEDFISNGYEIE